LNFKDMEKEELNKKLEEYYLEIAQRKLDLLSMDVEINNLITPFYVEIRRLPLSLRKTIVQDKLIEVNKYIISLAGKHDFYISDVLVNEAELEIEYQDFSVKDACMVLPVKPYQKCFNLGLTMQEENLLHDLLTKTSENWENTFWVNCPKGAKTYIFDIVDYVANMSFYVILLKMFMHNNYSKNAIEKSLSKLFQFQTNLTDEQRDKLFGLLVENKFISNGNNKDSFIWAFGGKKQPDNFEPIEWIDKHEKQPNNKNTQTFFELLYLLEEYKGVNKAKNPYNYEAINFCFKNFKDVRNKNPHQIMNDTPRKKLLKEIVDQVTEKQKK